MLIDKSNTTKLLSLLVLHKDSISYAYFDHVHWHIITKQFTTVGKCIFVYTSS